MQGYIQGPLVKFVDSPCYSELELCGGVVTGSSEVPPLASSALQNFLTWSSLFMVGKAQKSHGTRSGLYGIYSNGVPLIHFSQAEHNSIQV